jgi:hypothetical protein
MANKPILRVQVSLRRVVDFNEEQAGQDEKLPTGGKAAVQDRKAAKAQRSVEIADRLRVG